MQRFLVPNQSAVTFASATNGSFHQSYVVSARVPGEPWRQLSNPAIEGGGGLYVENRSKGREFQVKGLWQSNETPGLQGESASLKRENHAHRCVIGFNDGGSSDADFNDLVVTVEWKALHSAGLTPSAAPAGLTSVVLD